MQIRRSPVRIRSYPLLLHHVVLVGVVGNISACHADARGSIPRRGAFCKANLDSVRELPRGGRRFSVIPPKARGTITSTRYWLLCHCHLVKSDTFSIFAVSSLRRGHANLLCIVPIFTDDAEAFRSLTPTQSYTKLEAKLAHYGQCTKITDPTKAPRRGIEPRASA